MKRKEAVYRGLEYIDVYFTDNSATSPDYFQISEFPLRLTSGKNLFKLRGNPTNLKVGGILNFEVLDYNGNPIYSQVINYLDEDKSRVIAIYIYEDTPPGDCTITLIAEASVINGLPAPQEWQGRPNVKWTRTIPVNPNVSNISEIIFETEPTITVDEIVGVQLNRSYPGNTQFPVYTTGSVKYFSYNNQPAVEISGGLFTNDMSNGTITISTPNNPTPTPNYTIPTTVYQSTIKKILSPSLALLDQEYTVYSSQSISSHTYNAFDYSAFSLAYEATPIYTPTENSQSFAYLQIKGLDPATGDVSRIKVFTNNNGTPGTWELINDVELEETEIFVANTASIYPDRSIGLFSTQSVIDTYWTASIFQSTGTFPVTSLTWDTSSISNAMKISSSLDLSITNNVVVAKVKDTYPGIFIEKSAYKVTFDAYCKKIDSTTPKLSLYLSGSSFYADPVDYLNREYSRRFGKRIGEITGVDGQRFDDYVLSFESDYNGTGTLLLVVEGGEWQVSDIKTTTDNDAGYSPNYTRIKSYVNTTHKIGNQLNFKVEYYNVNGEKSKQISYVYNKDWQGGNRYIDGNYSMLTGSLYVADSLESGIAISGYPNSGFVRSLGYEGFDSGFPGFLLWSGSALPGQNTKGGVPYTGVGLELYANTSSYFRYSTTDSEIDVRTDKFFFGNPSLSYISGSNGIIQISSSNFLLSSSGDVYANDAIFSGTALANVITNKTIVITAANSSSYLQTYTLPNAAAPAQTGYRIRLDGFLGGEIGVVASINCTLLYPFGDVRLPSNPLGTGASIFTIFVNEVGNQMYNVFLDKTAPAPNYYDVINLTDGAVLNFVKVSGNNYSLGGTETPTSYTFRRSLTVGDGELTNNSGQTSGVVTIIRSGSNSGTTGRLGPELAFQNPTFPDMPLSIEQGTSLAVTNQLLNANEPYWGIFLGTTTTGAEPHIAFSGSANGDDRRTMLQSGVHYKYREISTNYSASVSDYFITATNSSGTVTITLPTGSYREEGRVLEFKYRQTGGTVVLSPSGTDTIDGVSTKTTTQINSAMKVVCNGLGRWNVMYTTGSWT